MTQSGYAVKTENRFEDYTSLKKYLAAYPHIVEHKREIPQTTTDAVAALEEVSGETIAAMTDETVIVYQKTDQVGTDGAATGKVTWATGAGVKTDATFALDETDTSTAMALVAATGAAADHIESFSLDEIDCADEVILGNAGKTEVYAVIKVGQHQCLKSKFMGRASARNFIGKLTVHLSLATALVTLVCTFTPKGESLSTTKTFTLKTAPKSWEPCLEIEPGTEVSWTIEDDNVAHPVAYVELTYVEAW